METCDHEKIIDMAFGPGGVGPQLSDTERTWLKKASSGVDSIWPGQAAKNAYQHSMRAPGQSVEEAQKLSADFIRRNLENAVGFEIESHRIAFDFLGKGMHTIADSYSPQHQGAQEWCGLSPTCWPSDYRHWRAEKGTDMGNPDKLAASALVKYYNSYLEMVRSRRSLRQPNAR
jgi:hypothetical protein